MAVDNDLSFARRVVDDLETAGIVTWLFGGWAKELLGLSLPRPHHDVDLLYPARHFGSVDALLVRGSLNEITAKRFPHKRAFEVDGVMVELFLVQSYDGSHYTDFWDSARHHWPGNLLDVQASGLRVASAMSLLDFRARWANYRPPTSSRPAGRTASPT